MIYAYIYIIICIIYIIEYIYIYHNLMIYVDNHFSASVKSKQSLRFPFRGNVGRLVALLRDGPTVSMDIATWTNDWQARFVPLETHGACLKPMEVSWNGGTPSYHPLMGFSIWSIHLRVPPFMEPPNKFSLGKTTMIVRTSTSAWKLLAATAAADRESCWPRFLSQNRNGAKEFRWQ